MEKQTILVTGTPCVGKTTVSLRLAKELDAFYINLTELAEKESLTLGEDEKRKTTIVNETKMRRKLKQIIQKETGNIVVDGHYAAAVVPKSLVTRVFVLRRNPLELRKFMENCGFQGPKLWENLAAEILDVCLVEALREQENDKVCELDVTGKPTENVVTDVIAVLKGQKKCRVGGVDWLGILETQGVLGEYLRV